VDGLHRVQGTDDGADLRVERRNGTNSTRAVRQSRTIAGHLIPHASANSSNRARAAASVAAV
jgi:hypothetical protein